MYNLGKTGRTRDARVFLFLLGYSQSVSSLNDDLLSDELTEQEVSFCQFISEIKKGSHQILVLSPSEEVERKQLPLMADNSFNQLLGRQAGNYPGNYLRPN